MKEKAKSVMILAAVMFMAITLQTTLMTAEVNYNPALAGISIPMSLLTFWSIFATMLNITDSNLVI